VRILPAKDHQQLAFNLGNPVQRVVIHAFAETPLVDVGRITTRRSEHFGIHRRSKSEVPADAEPHNTKLAGALGMRLQVVESDACIGIVTRQFLGDLIDIAAIRSSLIIGQHRARLFQFMKNLGHRHDEAMARQQRRSSPDRPGDLENLGKQDDARVPAFGDGTQNVGPHGSGLR